MKIRTVIVEDEPLARERLRNLLERDPEIEVIAECCDGRSAVATVLEHRPDLLFLDIQLPERNGFEVLADLGTARPRGIVFVTAYDRFAVKAFEVHAIDYLLKPFDIDRFAQALERAKQQLRVTAPPAQEAKVEAVPTVIPDQQQRIEELLASLRPSDQAAPKRLSVKSNGRLIFLDPENIDCVEASDNYIEILSGGETYRVRETLGAFESKLPAANFIRISRSAVVNIRRMKELQPCQYGEYTVVLLDGKRLTLTRGYRDALQRLRGG